MTANHSSFDTELNTAFTCCVKGENEGKKEKVKTLSNSQNCEGKEKFISSRLFSQASPSLVTFRNSDTLESLFISPQSMTPDSFISTLKTSSTQKAKQRKFKRESFKNCFTFATLCKIKRFYVSRFPTFIFFPGKNITDVESRRSSSLNSICFFLVPFKKSITT